ncbi:MAG: glycosyltransferase family 4 protein [Planctomycetota bacterium]
MTLRVALVSREYPPHSGGGIGTYARNIACALAAAGHTVHVVTQAFPGAEPSLHIDGPIHVHRVPMGDGSAGAALRGSINAGRAVARLARDLQIDVIEFPEYEAPATCYLLARRLGALETMDRPTVVHFHSPTEVNLALNREGTRDVPGGMGLLVALERSSVVAADHLCAPSRFMASWAHDQFALAEAPQVIPYAIGPLPPRSRPESAVRRLLYVGRLERRKGVDVLMQAWRAVGPQATDWELRLVGSDTGTGPGGGSMRTHLESMLDDDVRARTHLVGARQWWELHDEYATATACTVPSRWENFPNTCIEAMMHGRPMLASDNGGMREMLDGSNGGMLFRAEDVGSCTQALRRLVGMSPDALHMMGMCGRARIAAMCDPTAVAAARTSMYMQAIDNAHDSGSGSSSDRALEIWRDLRRVSSGTSVGLNDPLGLEHVGAMS